jgi:hypothetical protein
VDLPTRPMRPPAAGGVDTAPMPAVVQLPPLAYLRPTGKHHAPDMPVV